MNPKDGFLKHRWRLAVIASSCAICLPTGVPAGEWAPDNIVAGRYLDRNVLVHDEAQLDPLKHVVSFSFSPFITVEGALNTALSGTGYRLAPADPGPVSRLLDSQVALSHDRFDEKRIDSVVGALIGSGRGFDLEVDHVERQVRVQPINAPTAEPVRAAANWWRRLFRNRTAGAD